MGAELTAAGYEVESRNGLRAMGQGLHRALTTGYRSQDRRLPASLGAVFVVTGHPAGPPPSAGPSGRCTPGAWADSSARSTRTP